MVFSVLEGVVEIDIFPTDNSITLTSGNAPKSESNTILIVLYGCITISDPCLEINIINPLEALLLINILEGSKVGELPDIDLVPYPVPQDPLL